MTTRPRRTVNGFEVESRPVSDLLAAAADYNPRTITDRALDGLRSSVETFGLVAPIILNRQTGRVVSGHQRLRTLSPEEETDVLLVDLSEEKERALNLTLNSRHVQGRWTEGLEEILADLEDLDLGGELLLDDLALDVPVELPEEFDDALASITSGIEWVRAGGLRPHPRNYRGHPEEQLTQLKASLRRHGFFRNLVATRDGTLLMGHGVAQAAREIGVTRLPVVRVDLDPDDPRALKLLTADNEIARLCAPDDRELTEILRDVMELDVDGLEGTGFEPEMLANLVYVSRPVEEVRDKAAAAEWVGMPEYHESYDDEGEQLKLTVRFRCEEDRQEFGEKLGLDLSGRAGGQGQALWYPPRELMDRTKMRFQDEEEADAGG